MAKRRYPAVRKTQKPKGCAYCGADADAKVLHTWEFIAPLRPMSQNELKGMNPHEYKRIRASYEKICSMLKLADGIPNAGRKRRVVFTRLIGGTRRRRYDKANFIGGLKPFVDAMVKARLLVDDTEQYFEDHYKQRHGDEDNLHVRIEEL